MAEIGSVGYSNSQVISRREVQLGRGVDTALSGLASAVGQLADTGMDYASVKQNLASAYQNNQDKLTRAGLWSDFYKMNGELNRSLSELPRDLPPGARGYTDQAESIASKAHTDFLARVPENMRAEFIGQSESMLQSQISSAFSYETEAANTNYKFGLAEMTQTAMNEIARGESDMADWLPKINFYLEASPLDPNATQELRQVLVRQLAELDLGQVARESYTNPAAMRGTTGGPADGSDVVAAGLPAVLRGFLNATASVESPGYNVLNGGGTFSSYADHPGPNFRGEEGGPKRESSAAGRYQFIYETWKRAQRALNLPDFSPESQDRAAVWLAQQDYKAKTGRDLVLDLSSGDPALIDSVRKSLVSTWAGFGTEKSANNFYSIITGSEGTPNPLLNDPAYDSLSPDVRAKIVGAAESQAMQAMAEQVQNQALQVNSLMDQIKSVASGGNFIQAQTMLDQYNRGGVIPTYIAEEGARFIEIEQAKRKEAMDAQLSLSGASAYDPKSEEQVAAFTSYQEKIVAPILGEMDQAKFLTTVLPVVRNARAVPPGFEDQITSMISANDVRQTEFAMDVLVSLKSLAGPTFGKLSPDLQRMAVFYANMKNTMPAERLYGTIRREFDPTQREARQIRDQNARSFTTSKEGAPLVNTAAIAASIPGYSSDMPIDQPAFLLNETRETFNAISSDYNDPKEAWKAATELTAQIWGPTTVLGTPRLMRRPPELVYPADPMTGGHEYLNQQLKASVPLAEGESVILQSDQMTETDIAAGRLPSYPIMKVQKNGGIAPVTYETRDRTDRVIADRIYFDPSENKRVFVQSQAIAIEQEIKTRKAEQQKAEATGNNNTLEFRDATQLRSDIFNPPIPAKE